ncbi:MAG: hypothetical protein ACRDT8_15950 [Micromonosporaceae bacterium]
MQKTISYAELDLTTGELLPERAVMSTVMPSMFGYAEGGNVVVAFACSAGSSPATNTNSLLGIISATPSVGPACVPGGIVAG